MSLAWFLPLSDGYGWVDVDGVYNFACSLREVLAKHPFLPHGCGLVSGSYFPSFSEGLSLRLVIHPLLPTARSNFPSFSEGLSLRQGNRCDFAFPVWGFPFLFGRAFIEAEETVNQSTSQNQNFPSFSEGLSLRLAIIGHEGFLPYQFPFLFGRAFIEARTVRCFRS